MKKIKFLAVLFLSFILLIGARNVVNVPGKTSSLEIKGYVFQGKEKIDEALVKLYQNNNMVQMLKTKKGGKFQFVLFSGMVYLVEINKPGFVTERIQISTEAKTEFNGKYLYEFKVDLMKESIFKGIDISRLDFPTASIKYSSEEGEYVHDKVYSEFVKTEVNKIKEEAKNIK